MCEPRLVGYSLHSLGPVSHQIVFRADTLVGPSGRETNAVDTHIVLAWYIRGPALRLYLVSPRVRIFTRFATFRSFLSQGPDKRGEGRVGV